ncbi:trimeric intracellular cation channel type A isoform X1 [Hypanus sabinus]|uniref:trimeric intracellular cation channel type A isoform X1 n=1 Tax=Hypanus sabinus TaxID=79690 RepID=UPI0028C4E046|nr:trimeric intracellular cation channel type A isoform X1 [Hypanus sabinus]XP_059847700.1 trimeric intracellular cation channel type A isoform X1 [Hypanus sabinus]XP_059847701.1 trimeric intracellular cation channel type A isoform X1 [Hypanus sabinus]XP_059847702.1 trimeric intracellular cation channel type A isoform X1 [Hypanus sabinus]XP_059847703.1 trimeric intracellular cation channel type A isoform X1 [Hypanus sabinus]
MRMFKPGDKVLVLFPVQTNPLQAIFHGPYEIMSKINYVDYVIRTPDRRRPTQLCHINMIKPYYEKKSDTVTVVVNDNEFDLTRNMIDDSSEFHSKSNIVSVRLPNSTILENIDEKLAHLQPEQKQQMKKLIFKYKDLFPDVPRRTTIASHDVDVGDAKPIKQHPCRMNLEKCELAEKEIEYMLEDNIIRHSNSNWSSPCVMVPKPDGSIRFCTDYRKVNAVTKTDAYPIPRADDCVDKVGKAKFLTKIDLLKGYWCVPLTDRGREISAFVTPSGLYEYNVLPFGMKRMINSVIYGLKDTDAYIDDLVTGNDTWEAHIIAVEKLFERLSKANLTINLAKSEFGHATVTYLGYVVGQGKVAPVQAKVRAILEIPTPTGKKTLRRFLGMVGYYRKFCKNFANVALPFTNLLQKNVKFVWTVPCQEAFEKLKTMICQQPVLKAPDFEKPFSLAVDASDEAAGAVLIQRNEGDEVDHPVAYFSKRFNKHQRNYLTIEKELLSHFSFRIFDVYVGTTQKPLIVYTDHNPLVFLSEMKNKNQRLLNWSLMLQEYNIVITHIKGKDNVVADCLSRC